MKESDQWLLLIELDTIIFMGMCMPLKWSYRIMSYIGPPLLRIYLGMYI